MLMAALPQKKQEVRIPPALLFRAALQAPLFCPLVALQNLPAAAFLLQARQIPPRCLQAEGWKLAFALPVLPLELPELKCAALPEWTAAMAGRKAGMRLIAKSAALLIGWLFSLQVVRLQEAGHLAGREGKPPALSAAASPMALAAECFAAEAAALFSCRMGIPGILSRRAGRIRTELHLAPLQSGWKETAGLMQTSANRLPPAFLLQFLFAQARLPARQGRTCKACVPPFAFRKAGRQMCRNRTPAEKCFLFRLGAWGRKAGLAKA